MFGPPGHAYVYRIYGLHWCFNIVATAGSAVLVRALEPTAGLDLMRRRRGLDDPRTLCSGPGRLCAALAITGALDGASLDRPPFEIRLARGARAVSVTPRIGLTRNAAAPLRFVETGSRFASRREMRRS
jgi:DNA-3-methyladenine glycosylase